MKLRRHAVELAFQANDEGVQMKMTQWLIERDKPRKTEVTISPILAINQAIITARGTFADLAREYTVNENTRTSDAVARDVAQ